MKKPRWLILYCLCISTVCTSISLNAEIKRFTLPNSKVKEVWRITNDPTIRDYAGIYAAKKFSPDGRYLGYVHFASDEVEFGAKEAAEVHVYDFFENRDILVDKGILSRWANNHNWLFYLRFNSSPIAPGKANTDLVWYELDSKRKTVLAQGLEYLGETDHLDRWIFGGIPDIDDPAPPNPYTSNNRAVQGVRVAIQKNSSIEKLHGKLVGRQWYPNPGHPVVVARINDALPTPEFNSRAELLPSRMWFDLDGSNSRVGAPNIHRGHNAWSGDGAYYLTGRSPLFGREWDEPYPSNYHILGVVSRSGDIGANGKSGRWLTGGGAGGGQQPLILVDLRSGDSDLMMNPHSLIVYPKIQGKPGDGSTVFDADPSGSPDGTKVGFSTNYDLINGPVATTTCSVTIGDSRINVESTEGFPLRGQLAEGSRSGQVLSYTFKTDTTFEGIVYGLYDTAKFNLRKGAHLTSFENRLISKELFDKLPIPLRYVRERILDMDSPLMRQKSLDAYVAVVRLPDRPFLRVIKNHVELIPGENHWETYGYDIYKDDKKINKRPFRPGLDFNLTSSGSYTAVSVEWSGLRSKSSLPIDIVTPKNLQVLDEKPDEFSWTYERWLINGNEVTKMQAKESEESLRELWHRYDGIIRREWYRKDSLEKLNDLNKDGKTIRQLLYTDGKDSVRKYYTKEGYHRSTEYYNPDGWITESIIYLIDGEQGGQGVEAHWWYDQGDPVKLIGYDYIAASKGPGVYVKIDNDWVKQD